MQSTLFALLLWTIGILGQFSTVSVWPPSPGMADDHLGYGSCPAVEWNMPKPYRLNPHELEPDLKDLLSEINESRLRAIVEKLVSFGTRHTLSTQTDPKRGIGAARDWIASEFNKYAATSGGNMKVEVQSYMQPPASRIPNEVKISNVLARLEGAKDPSRVYVISGHYDSLNSDFLDGEGDAPGANDDASGVAVVMELCRIMASRRPAASIIFAAVAGEEQGLYGSAYLAKTLKASNTNVEAMLNNDIVGGDTTLGKQTTLRMFAQGLSLNAPFADPETVLRIGAENDSPSRQLARYADEIHAASGTDLDLATVYRLDRFLRAGDHSSFLAQGFPAVRFTEATENFDHQHQAVRVENGTQFGDLVEFVDFAFVAKVARVNMATLWSLAQGPGMVRNVTVETSVLENATRLMWAAGKKGLVSGYELLWRATNAPLWTHSVPIGAGTSARFGLSKDNFIFGIRALGTNYYRGPASIPFPAG